MTPYCLDTNSFSEGVKHYPIEVFPPIWTAIGRWMESGDIISTFDVLEELRAFHKTDSLANWLKQREASFLELDDEMQGIISQIVNDPVCQRTVDYRKRKGRGGSGADPTVIALAKSRGGCVVTYEEMSKHPEKSPKIPDVCRAMKVRCIKPIELIRALDLHL